MELTHNLDIVEALNLPRHYQSDAVRYETTVSREHIMDSPSRGTIRPATQDDEDDPPAPNSRRLVPPSGLGLDPVRHSPGQSSYLGHHGDTSPQGTTTFAQAVGYHPSADRGSISPTNVAMRSPASERPLHFQPIGEDAYQESEDVRPQQQVSPLSYVDRLVFLFLLCAYSERV